MSSQGLEDDPWETGVRSPPSLTCKLQILMLGEEGLS